MTTEIIRHYGNEYILSMSGGNQEDTDAVSLINQDVKRKLMKNMPISDCSLKWYQDVFNQLWSRVREKELLLWVVERNIKQTE